MHTGAVWVAILAVAAALIAAGMFVPAPAAGTATLSSLEDLQAYVASAGTGVGGYRDAFLAAESAAPAAAPAAGDARGYSGTNIQVAGVDEADIVKTDGRYLYTVAGTQVRIVDTAAGLAAVATVEVDHPIHEIYVNNGRLIVFANKQEVSQAYPAAGRLIAPVPFTAPELLIRVYSLQEPAAPQLAQELSLEGWYQDARMVGDWVYVVATTPVYREDVHPPLLREDGLAQEGFPEILLFPGPPVADQYTTILSLHVQSGEHARTTALAGFADVLYASPGSLYLVHPKRADYAGLQQQVREEAILPLLPLQEQAQVRSVLSAPLEEWEKDQQVGEVLEQYSASLSQVDALAFQASLQERMLAIQQRFSREAQKTVIQRFALQGGQVTHAATGEVPGTVLNQFSMDEHDGFFRIATTTEPSFWGGPFWMGGGVARGIAVDDVIFEGGASGEVAGSSGAVPQVEAVPLEGLPAPAPAAPFETFAAPDEPITRPPEAQSASNVYVLDPDLEIAGSLEGLAPGERIFAARFLGDRVYLVTFVQVDPLFVIDLGDPANPRVLGELKIPGVSQYLHPYGEDFLIGIGKDATAVDEGGPRALFQGVKISLFDVRDVANPREIASDVIGSRGTDSEVLWDHKAFLFSAEKGVLVLPVILTEPSPSASIWEWSPPTWQGAYVYRVSEQGLELQGRITHVEDDGPASDQFYAGSPFSIRRSLYIGTALYTISDHVVKANDLATLEQLAVLEFPE
ncbi:MAG: beta-propeller domain-containing protein [Candidatus Aenigmarchaeota archaeon]|nr:beta-propeller domain-containing protein [Candidatus Aenigmarchaeota archaeon]